LSLATQDWDAWLSPRGAAHPDSPEELLREILLKIPGRRQKTIADFGCGRAVPLEFLAAHYGRVVAIDPAPLRVAAPEELHAGPGVELRRRELTDLAPFAARFDVALAPETLAEASQGDPGRVLVEIRRSLVEGGILVVTTPASSPGRRPYPFALGRSGAVTALHELELQYELCRAGFQGLRLRRLVGTDGGRETLLGMAVRRAPN
jgi:SAM-dependent methyltransferase